MHTENLCEEDRFRSAFIYPTWPLTTSELAGALKNLNAGTSIFVRGQHIQCVWKEAAKANTRSFKLGDPPEKCGILVRNFLDPMYREYCYFDCFQSTISTAIADAQSEINGTAPTDFIDRAVIDELCELV